jgi:hypothetical protein
MGRSTDAGPGVDPENDPHADRPVDDEIHCGSTTKGKS